MALRLKGKGKRSKPCFETNGYHSQNGDHESSKKARANGVSKVELFMADNLTSAEFIQDLKCAWSDGKKEDVKLSNGACTVIRNPFHCCAVKNLVANKELLEPLVEELHDLNLRDKNNDLFKFKQSYSDLQESKSPYIVGLKHFLKVQVKPWLETVTGAVLEDTIDMFCAKYGYTDHLLCHDDELEGRRIAYIMYFVKDWTSEDGGTLDLFDRDEFGQPCKVVKSLVPVTNSIVFFEVTDKSFHQVAEILTKDKTRISVGGWFHGQSVERPAKLVPEPLEMNYLRAEDIDEDDFYAWVNPMYLDPEVQAEISEKFEVSSEISLPNFLAEEKFKEVSMALQRVKDWKRVGPANKKCFDVLEKYDSDDESVIAKCVQFMRSDATFLLFSSITGLRLHPMAPEDSEGEGEDDDDDENGERENGEEDLEEEEIVASTSKPSTPKSDSESKTDIDPRCKIQVRRWKRGMYTLLHDNDQDDDAKYSLDGRLFFNCSDWSLDYGGFSSYVAKDEDEELLTAAPEENTLTLIYKDSHTLGFVKYVNDGISAVPNKEFHDLSAVYYE